MCNSSHHAFMVDYNFMNVKCSLHILDLMYNRHFIMFIISHQLLSLNKSCKF